MVQDGRRLRELVIAVRNEYGVNASLGQMRIVGITANNANARLMV
jgi:hypothetical protein